MNIFHTIAINKKNLLGILLCIAFFSCTKQEEVLSETQNSLYQTGGPEDVNMLLKLAVKGNVSELTAFKNKLNETNETNFLKLFKATDKNGKSCFGRLCYNAEYISLETWQCLLNDITLEKRYELFKATGKNWKSCFDRLCYNAEYISLETWQCLLNGITLENRYALFEATDKDEKSCFDRLCYNAEYISLETWQCLLNGITLENRYALFEATDKDEKSCFYWLCSNAEYISPEKWKYLLDGITPENRYALFKATDKDEQSCFYWLCLNAKYISPKTWECLLNDITQENRYALFKATDKDEQSCFYWLCSNAEYISPEKWKYLLDGITPEKLADLFDGVVDSAAQKWFDCLWEQKTIYKLFDVDKLYKFVIAMQDKTISNALHTAIQKKNWEWIERWLAKPELDQRTYLGVMLFTRDETGKRPLDYCTPDMPLEIREVLEKIVEALEIMYNNTKRRQRLWVMMKVMMKNDKLSIMDYYGPPATREVIDMLVPPIIKKYN